MSADEIGIVSEQIKGLTTLINAQFLEVHERLDKINGKVGKHDDQITEVLIERAKNREEQKNIVPNHIATCPLNGKVNDIENTVDGFKDCKDKINVIEKSLEDVNFFMRHPKLFIAGLSIVVILTVATFLNNNPFKVFDREPVKTEINVQE